ncbi:MAG: DNA mismatch repair ATPase msh1 [Candelina submexicana]|nr:MAG: DNA mismatch repair ATPase msh1 [Candelina submexicana]
MRPVFPWPHHLRGTYITDRSYRPPTWYPKVQPYLVSIPTWSTPYSSRRPQLARPKTCLRGKKIKTTAKLQELPQGVIALQPITAEELKDEPSGYPTVVQQARNNMRKFDNCVLLTRVGGFYELYFEHADEYGPLLNLKVAQKKTVAGPAGFPIVQLDRYLKVLVQDLTKYVAISEEFPANATGKVGSGGLLFDRKVTRVVTPGTLIDENFMDPSVNNFLLAIHYGDESSPTDLDINTDCDGRDGLNISDIGNLRSSAIGLAWLDLSTGEFFTQSTTLSSLLPAVARIDPREIILEANIQAKPAYKQLSNVLREFHHLLSFHQSSPSISKVSDWTPMLESAITSSAEADFTEEEIMAGSSLLNFVKAQLQGLTMKLRPPVRRQAMENMGIDRNSLRALEIKTTARDGVSKGSLLHAVRRTVTKSGARLLTDWLASPSTSLAVINSRLDLVSHFLNDQELREEITALLRRSHDTLRLIQKFSLGRGNADDLVAISRTIEATQGVVRLLSPYCSESKGESAPGESRFKTRSQASPDAVVQIFARLSTDGPTALARRINDAIDEEGLVQTHRREEAESKDMAFLAQDVLADEGSVEDLKSMPKKVRPNQNTKERAARELEAEVDDVWIMRKTLVSRSLGLVYHISPAQSSASTTLNQLHESLDSLREERVHLAKELRERLGVSSLTLRWTPSLGHIAHIKGKDLSTPLSSLGITRSVSSSKSTRSFYLAEWTNLGTRIDQVRTRIRAAEQEVFQDLRKQVVANLVQLRRNAVVLDELDIATSSAVLADEQKLVRPILNNSTTHRIIGGSHPTVKLGLQEAGRSFVRNDCSVGERERIWLITGPNMAGKSTFLRQNALISILAQIGSYVPADYAEIGIVDQIFSRVGSADNLSQDQSTFMVEMLETATILRQATAKSFVIMDEVGRGTTPEDGIAVGYACLHHLHFTNRCRTLFATHFHKLADMTRGFESLGCYCTDVDEGDKGSFSYVHRLREGVNRHSHALKVARLADSSTQLKANQ